MAERTALPKLCWARAPESYLRRSRRALQLPTRLATSVAGKLLREPSFDQNPDHARANIWPALRQHLANLDQTPPMWAPTCWGRDWPTSANTLANADQTLGQTWAKVWPTPDKLCQTIEELGEICSIAARWWPSLAAARPRLAGILEQVGLPELVGSMLAVVGHLRSSAGSLEVSLGVASFRQVSGDFVLSAMVGLCRAAAIIRLVALQAVAGRVVALWQTVSCAVVPSLVCLVAVLAYPSCCDLVVSSLLVVALALVLRALPPFVSGGPLAMQCLECAAWPAVSCSRAPPSDLLGIRPVATALGNKWSTEGASSGGRS